MKKMIFFIPLLSFSMTIGDLFNAVNKIPESKIDLLSVKNAEISKKEVKSKKLPQVSFIASFEHYNFPMSIRPLAPTETTLLIKEGGAIPFGQNIGKIGFSFSMPLFVKSLNDTSKKMKKILQAKIYQRKINLLKRKALLVNLVSNLDYINSLIKALKLKRQSIQTTLNAIEVGVKNGAFPEFDALKLKDAINQIDINIQNALIKKAEIKADIYKLTKMNVDNLDFKIVGSVKKGAFFTLNPLKELAKANKENITIAKDSYVPQIVLKASAIRAYTKAYNNGENTYMNVANIGVYLKWDILNFANSKNVEKQKVLYQKSVLEYQKARKDLIAEVNQIDSSLKYLKKALVDAINSVALKEELLKSAKVAFKLREMSVKEYLSYEDDLEMARANLAKLKALKASLIAQKAFIYGNNFERIFK